MGTTELRASIRSDMREGREIGIRRCCRLRFAFEYALDPEGEQAVRRGVRFTDDGDVFVPCGLIHHAALSHAAFERFLAHL